MTKPSTGRGEETIGLNLGDRHSYFCVLDGKGQVVEEGRVATTRDGLRRQFGRWATARIALEVGAHSPWASRLLLEMWHEVLVANPPKKTRDAPGDSSKARDRR